MSENDSDELGKIQGLLLTGEGLQEMTPERIEELRRMVGEFTLTVTVISNLEAISTTIEEEKSPLIPTNYDDFKHFANEHGFNDRRARCAWETVQLTGELDRKYADVDNYGIPHLHFLGVHEDDPYKVVDLQSIKERLIWTEFSPIAWARGSRARVEFLIAIASTRIGFDD